jgi:hypothetical protein
LNAYGHEGGNIPQSLDGPEVNDGPSIPAATPLHDEDMEGGAAGAHAFATNFYERLGGKFGIFDYIIVYVTNNSKINGFRPDNWSDSEWDRHQLGRGTLLSGRQSPLRSNTVRPPFAYAYRQQF